jgi:hypothetical protein
MTEAFEQALEIFASGQLTMDELKAIKQAIDDRVLDTTPPHVTGDPRVIRVGGKRINLITTGHEQRLQIEALREWIVKDLAPKLAKGDWKRWGEGDVTLGDLTDVIIPLLDTSCLVRLGMIISREDREFVEENFDLAWIVHGFMAIMRFQPGLKEVKRLWHKRAQL